MTTKPSADKSSEDEFKHFTDWLAAAPIGEIIDRLVAEATAEGSARHAFKMDYARELQERVELMRYEMLRRIDSERARKDLV